MAELFRYRQVWQRIKWKRAIGERTERVIGRRTWGSSIHSFIQQTFLQTFVQTKSVLGMCVARIHQSSVLREEGETDKTMTSQSSR
jgi:hypothetical protein